MKVALVLFVGLIILYVLLARFKNQELTVPENFPVLEPTEVAIAPAAPDAEVELATFGSGCFWCTEAVFQQMKGVRKVESGYSGGSVKNPTYEEVCTGFTGHAEVVQVTFDPKNRFVSGTGLRCSGRSHDPTTCVNSAGGKRTLAPSTVLVIFYHSERQKQLAERYKAKIDAAGVYPVPVVTEIAPFA